MDERREEKAKFAQYIGKHLRKMRKKKGLSQEKLSLTAGYSTTFVGKVEQAKYSPSMHAIWRLARTLNLTLSEFFQDFK